MRDGLAAASVEKFSLIGFDACLMQSYAVVAALSPYANYHLASEELEPAHGWDYHASLLALRYSGHSMLFEMEEVEFKGLETLTANLGLR